MSPPWAWADRYFHAKRMPGSSISGMPLSPFCYLESKEILKNQSLEYAVALKTVKSGRIFRATYR
jgi:hypothetical protein